MPDRNDRNFGTLRGQKLQRVQWSHTRSHFEMNVSPPDFSGRARERNLLPCFDRVSYDYQYL